MNNDRKALKSGVWYTVSNFIIKSIAFLTTPVFARLLSKADFGSYNNFTSWLAIITIIVTMNLESTLISARYDHDKSIDSYILSVLVLSSCSVVVWITIINLFGGFFSSWFEMDISYINGMMAYLFFLPAVNLFMSRERYCFEYKKTVAISLIVSISTALLSVILVVFLNDKLNGRIIGTIIPTIIVGFFCYIYFIRKGKQIKISYWQYALPICIPYIPHMLSLNLLNSMDRVMINRWCGAEQTAVYSLAYTCGSMVTLMMISMNGAFAPWLGEKLNEKKYRDVKKVSKPYILGFCYFAIGIMIFAPEALLILGGKAYLESKYVIAPIAMGCVCQFLYTMFVNIEQFKKKTIGMAIASFAAALVNFVLNYVLIPQYGYIVAAYTTLVGYMVLLGIHMFVVYKMNLYEVYDYKFIGIIIIVGTLITGIVTLTYENNIIRYSFGLLYIALGISIFIKNKEMFERLIRNRRIKNN